MGVASITWSEIDAWLSVTETNLSVWEKITLKEMSEVYATELIQATAKDRPAPYVSEEQKAEMNRKAVASKLKNFFSSFKRKPETQD